MSIKQITSITFALFILGACSVDQEELEDTGTEEDSSEEKKQSTKKESPEVEELPDGRRIVRRRSAAN